MDELDQSLEKSRYWMTALHVGGVVLMTADERSFEQLAVMSESAKRVIFNVASQIGAEAWHPYSRSFVTVR